MCNQGSSKCHELYFRNNYNASKLVTENRKNILNPKALTMILFAELLLPVGVIRRLCAFVFVV
jgi:hypothetical protein